MTWNQFKDPGSHMCLAYAMVASWSLTQEVADSIPFNDNYFCPGVNSEKTFRKNSIFHNALVLLFNRAFL